MACLLVSHWPARQQCLLVVLNGNSATGRRVMLSMMPPDTFCFGFLFSYSLCQGPAFSFRELQEGGFLPTLNWNISLEELFAKDRMGRGGRDISYLITPLVCHTITTVSVYRACHSCPVACAVFIMFLPYTL